PARSQPPPAAEDGRSRDGRRGMVARQVVQGDPLLTPDEWRTFGPRRGPQHEARAAALQQGVRRNGRTMNEKGNGEGGRGRGEGCTRPSSTLPRPQSIDRSEQADARVRRRAGHLSDFDSAVGSECDEIGECPADVDTDAGHGRKRRLTRKAMPVRVSATTRVPTQSPNRTYSGITSVVRITPATNVRVSSLVAWYVRPIGSTNSEIPEFAARATPMRVSIARRIRCDACCRGAVVAPNHASLVMLSKK